MCMAYFAGHGYSGGFVAHMAGLLRELQADTPVCLTAATDAVCLPCPNNRNGLCDKPELVADWDRAVLRLCGLEEGCTLAFGDFVARVQARILGPGLRSGICGGCQWNSLCASRPSRWAAQPEKF